MAFLEKMQELISKYEQALEAHDRAEAEKQERLQREKKEKTRATLSRVMALLDANDAEMLLDEGAIQIGSWICYIRTKQPVDKFGGPRYPVIESGDRVQFGKQEYNGEFFDARFSYRFNTDGDDELSDELDNLGGYAPRYPTPGCWFDFRFVVTDDGILEDCLKELAKNMYRLRDKIAESHEQIINWRKGVCSQIERIKNKSNTPETLPGDQEVSFLDAFRNLVSKMDEDELALAQSILFNEIVDTKVRHEFDRYDF